MKSLLVKVLLAFSLSLPPSLATARNTPATVVSIGDGDTLRIRESGQVTTIRLACVDAPERAQSPWGQQATSRLKQLLPPGTAVQVREITRDRYGRTVAELYVANKSINLQIVKEGFAVVYRQYLDECTVTKDQYLQAEAQAFAKRLGFWNQKSPLMPWDYRQGKRSGNPQPKIKVIPSGQSQTLPNCINSDCNCSDFRTQAQAQRVFNAFPGDRFRLDGDSDRRACESLP